MDEHIRASMTACEPKRIHKDDTERAAVPMVPRVTPAPSHVRLGVVSSHAWKRANRNPGLSPR